MRHTDAAREKMRGAAKGKFVKEKSSQWKGGRMRDSAGYVHVMVDILPESLRAHVDEPQNRSKYVLEHRAVASAKIGRPIRRDEVVHHINGVKDDNRPENLEVVPRAAHSRAHRDIEREAAILRVENARLKAEVAALKRRIRDARKRSALPAGQLPLAGEWVQ